MIDAVDQILSRCSTPQTNINPTILFNEGWMTRLLVEVSKNAGIQIGSIDFGKIRHWYSEGLLSSPFLARSRNDYLAEGYTHADMALGDFRVNSANRGDISVEGSVGLFGVIEAKMGSPLSAGTKNAPDYNQASRNLACIAFNTLSSEHDIFFAVIAPEKKIAEHGIEAQVDPSRMTNQIAERFEMYDRNSKVYALKEKVLARANSCACLVLSYESWIEALAGHLAYRHLREFREKCYLFNRIG
ncbi:MAG: hypothetical protein SWE60_01875 [Thermodesulfobacteriota bacterium]|nr:hypothetical protein [Thermodesulfobacteriota bacterium]